MKGLLRKLLCITLPEEGPVYSPASSEFEWVETTSDYTFHPTVKDTSNQRSKWTRTTTSISTDTGLTKRKCKKCKCVTEIVQIVNDRKDDTDGPDCTLQFIQQPSKSGDHQDITNIPIGHMIGEWEKKGYTKALQYGEPVNHRYSRYLGTLKCAGCKKNKVHYNLSVLLQDSEKSMGAKYYLTVGDVPRASGKAVSANSTT